MAKASDEPLFSVVSPVYNVARYLPAFFASLEAQSWGIENLDIVLVDDGSTDASLAACEAFAARWPKTVRVVTQPNGGQASARNLGITLARGKWLSMPDPDDTLDPAFFSEISAFLDSHSGEQSPTLLSTSITVVNERTGARKRTHPLERKFRYGNRVADLAVEADNIQMSGATALFLLSVIKREKISFDSRIRPNFEDGHFIANYLLRQEHWRIGLVASARYYYLTRKDGSSTLDLSRTHPGRYTDVPRFGFLPVLQLAAKLHGSAPRWLQEMILYNLVWYMRADIAVRSQTGALPTAVLDEFHELMRLIMPFIDHDLIDVFSTVPLPSDVRFALAHGYDPEPVAQHQVDLVDQDLPRGLVRLRYLFTHERPTEVVYVDSAPTAPAYAKDRAIRLYGRVLAYERVLWVPLGARTAIALNGRLVPIGEAEPSPRALTLESHFTKGRALRAVNDRSEPLRHPTESLRSRAYKRVRELRRSLSRTRLRERAVLTALSVGLHARSTRRAFHDAWVFLDRTDFANDNAEHLYRYAREHCPDINSWFVINRDSPDWRRLSREGFRLVAYGSLRWRLLLLSAAHVVSSHADQFAFAPPQLARFGPRRWRFTFLRHGVMGNDTSRWLAGKPIDMVVTTSPTEHAAFVEDGSTYTLTAKEARLTGMSRHDALVEKRATTSDAERDLVLIMPTWRSYLRRARGEAEEHARARFASSAYAQAFGALLASESIKRTAAENGLRLIFMPHPNIAPYLDTFAVPDHFEVRRYIDGDVQQLLARAAVVLTDYSSLHFEAAKIEVPVVYFQFDSAEMFGGNHNYRRGHFEYETHGFGPVFADLSEVEEWMSARRPGQRPDPKYLERMHAGFAFHDTNNRARIIAAMRGLDQPWHAADD